MSEPKPRHKKPSPRPAAQHHQTPAKPAKKDSALKQFFNSAMRWLKQMQPKKTAPAAQSTATNSGTVKFFSRSKGFGFIRDDNGQELFVHISSLNGDIRVNDRVSFSISTDDKRGLSAVNVTRTAKGSKPRQQPRKKGPRKSSGKEKPSGAE